MREKILKRVAWLSVFSAIEVDAIADSIMEELILLEKKHPNDADLGKVLRSEIKKP